jgi:NitT/TauT family transport system permease protein
MGFILGVIFGITLAVLTSLFPIANVFIKPIINIIKSTPVASFIILTLVWIKGGQVPILISLLMVLPMIWANILKGIMQTDKRLLDVAKVYNFSRIKTITKIYIPSIMPYFIASSTTAMGFAWKAGISAEVIANTGFSIGGQIYNSKIYLETADLFAWTIVVIILSVIIEKLMVFAMKKFSNKYKLECRTSCEVKR